MKISEAIGYGLLAGIGILVLKFAGGIEGLKGMFAGITDIGKAPEFKSPIDILTETAELEQQYEALTPAGQELAQAKVAIEEVKTALPTTPEYQYLEFLEKTPFAWIPFIGDIPKVATQAVETKLTGIEEAATLKYMNETPQHVPHIKTEFYTEIPTDIGITVPTAAIAGAKIGAIVGIP